MCVLCKLHCTLYIYTTVDYSVQWRGECIDLQSTALHTRAGPQSKNWSDQQNTLDPTGSVHKKARGKNFDPKKVDFDEGGGT